MAATPCHHLKSVVGDDYRCELRTNNFNSSAVNVMKMGIMLKIFLSVALLATIIEGHSIYPPDFYNLDIHNFQFFKYPGRPTRYGVKQIHQEPTITQGAKAIYVYFRNLLLGHPVQQNTYNIAFDPDRGMRLRAAYQRQFGYRGENLIAFIGNGHSAKQLRYHDAIGRDFGKY